MPARGFKSLLLRFHFYAGPLVKWLRHRPFTAVTRVRIPYGSLAAYGCYFFTEKLKHLEDYPSPAEGNGLENRQACKSAQGFESLILLLHI